MDIESFDWSLEVELSENKEARRECETQAVEQIAESLEIPRETQSVGAEQYSALKDSYSSGAGARLLRTDVSSSHHTLDAKAARRNLKKRLDLNTWREDMARRDDDKVSHLQPHVAPIPMSAGQDTLDIWTVRNNLRSRYDLNSWRQP